MKTEITINPIEALKEEFAARYGLDINIQVWVHDVPTEKAEQIAKDFNLDYKATIEGNRTVHQPTWNSNLDFDIYVVEKGEE